MEPRADAGGWASNLFNFTHTAEQTGCLHGPESQVGYILIHTFCRCITFRTADILWYSQRRAD